MKVRVYVINEWCPSRYFGLKSDEDGCVLYGAPNNWKTKAGAVRWATKRGFEVVG